MSELFTGTEYLESLRDGRNVYVNGEKVRDVTTHPKPEYKASFMAGSLQRYEAFVQECMNDYDQNGWLRGPWCDQRSCEQNGVKSCVE